MKVAGWAGYPVSHSKVSTPNSIEDLKSIVCQTKGPAIARAQGRSYGDSSISSAIFLLNKINNILQFDTVNGILEVQAGISIQQLLPIIISKGWFLPVTPGTKFVSMGGLIASDVHGKNHHNSGCLSEHILSMKLLLGTGDIIECSKDNQSDLFHASCGGMGLTGVIISAKLKLKPIASSIISEGKQKVKSLEETIELFETNNSTYTYSWIDCLSPEVRSIVTFGEHAAVGRLEYKKKSTFSLPFNAPSSLLNHTAISIVNEFYFRKANLHQQERDILSFFYPLDLFKSWKELYGKKGFIQYQFVLPYKEGLFGLKKIIEEISKRELIPVMSSLKKLAPKNKNLLSFPIDGYTLAMDFQRTDSLTAHLSTLNDLVVDFGGKIYLTKDSFLSEKHFKKMYRKWEEFEEVREKYGALGKFSSQQSYRLGLK